jgi:hypothetical protein
LPLGVTRVLVEDLVKQGYLRVHVTLDDSMTIDERRELTRRTSKACEHSEGRGRQLDEDRHLRRARGRQNDVRTPGTYTLHDAVEMNH